MKALVTVASRHGATAEIGERITKRLRDDGVAAEIHAPESITSLDGFDLAVVGSAVYAGRWLPAARTFVERMADDLAAVPVWMFSSGPVGDPLFPSDEPEEPAALAAHIGAREHRVLAGRVDRALLTRAERVIMRVMRAPTGDFRDWDAIDAWASHIASSVADRSA